jgi:uncharacterized membrane protein
MKIILENTVAALKAEVQRIEVTIQHLTGLLTGTTTGTSAPPAPAAPAPRAKVAKPAKVAKVKRAYTRRAAEPATAAPIRVAASDSTDSWTPKTGSVTHQVLVALSKAPEPFSVASLGVMLPDMEQNAIGTELWKLGRAGFVADSGREGNMKLYKRGGRTIVAA